MKAADNIRVVIVDDEPLARQRLRRLLTAEDGVEIVEECASGLEAIDAVERLSPDLLLLDVQMPGLDGFGVVAELAEDAMPLIVFVTAFDEHALKAFDVHAVDYVLKPIDPDRLRTAIERAKQLHADSAVAEQYRRIRSLVGEMPSAGRGEPRFVVKENGRIFFVKAADVDWVEAAGNYVRLHVGPAAHMIRATIAAVEQALPAANFARIHRSAIVNAERVVELRQWSSGDYIVVLSTGTKLKLSRSYRDNLERIVSGLR